MIQEFECRWTNSFWNTFWSQIQGKQDKNCGWLDHLKPLIYIPSNKISHLLRYKLAAALHVGDNFGQTLEKIITKYKATFLASQNGFMDTGDIPINHTAVTSSQNFQRKNESIGVISIILLPASLLIRLTFLYKSTVQRIIEPRKYVNKWLSTSPFHSLSRRDLLFVVLSHQTNTRLDFYYQLPRIRDKASRLMKTRKIDNQTGCCETIYLGWHRCLDSHLTSAFVDTCRRYYSLYRAFLRLLFNFDARTGWKHFCFRLIDGNLWTTPISTLESLEDQSSAVLALLWEFL